MQRRCANQTNQNKYKTFIAIMNFIKSCHHFKELRLDFLRSHKFHRLE